MDKTEQQRETVKYHTTTKILEDNIKVKHCKIEIFAKN